jgi:ribosome maturation factor RimP
MRDTLDSIKSEISPVLDNAGAELVDISLKRMPNGVVLTLLVDTGKGISVDECAAINKRVSDILEERDIISQRYVVEVSSPGLDRPLRTQKDFKGAIGEKVDIWLTQQSQGRDFICGIVKQACEDTLEIQEKNGKMIFLPYENINKAKRVF